MKTPFVVRMLVILALCLLIGMTAVAHPGSGIVVDRQGNIYFVDTGSGVFKIDRNGRLTRLSGPAYHWMAIDIDDRLKDAKLPSFSSGGATVTRAGVNPTLLLASDFPIAIGGDGCLYYPWLPAGEQLQIFRLTPSGNLTVLKVLPASTESGPLRWLNGITAAPDGSVYYTENRAVRRITPEGKLTTVAEDVNLSGSDSVQGKGEDLGPYFRGLDVDEQANVYVAATGRRSVLKITPQGEVSTVLQAPGSWSPTGVALFRGEVFVLEWREPPPSREDVRSDWIPRVRKIGRDGTVTTLATVSR